MRLIWIILFAICLISSVITSEQIPSDGIISGADVNKDRKRFPSGNRIGNRRRKPGNRPIGQAVDDDSDDRARQGGQRQGTSHADDEDDVDQTGENRIRVISAGFRRIDSPSLRRLDDPTLSDDDLNRFEDNNLENELNALADGLEDKNDENKDGRSYKGLGIADAGLDHQQDRLGAEGDRDEELVDTGPPWMEWAHCNITCGVGRQSRWRRCRDEWTGVCNRVTGREMEWRRCLGMECDKKTIEELGGGCKDQFVMTLVLGVMVGMFGALALSISGTWLYNWCKQPSEWKISDLCPTCKCDDCCATGCCDSPGCQTCCQGCNGLCCCYGDPYYARDHMYYQKQLRMNQAYQQHHNLDIGRSTYYKRPPAPLPRESVKEKPYGDEREYYADRNRYYQASPRKPPEKPKPRESVKKKPVYEEPDYAEIDGFYPSSPRKQQEKPKSVKSKKRARRYDSLDEDDTDEPVKQVENDYLEIMGDEDDDDTYMKPVPRGGPAYVSDFEYLDAPPQRPQRPQRPR